MAFDIDKVRQIVKFALKEDLGQGDLTANLLVSPDAKVRAVIIAKESGVIAGIPVVEEVFRLAAVESGAIREGLAFEPGIKDGEKIKKGQVIAELSGLARALLIGERTALNFLQRLSGIATLTWQYVIDVVKVSKKT